MNPMHGEALFGDRFETLTHKRRGTYRLLAPLTRIEYLSTEQLVEINKRVLKDIKVKRADSHRVANRKKLDSVVEEVRALDGGAYEKAACLLDRPDEEARLRQRNRRTAYAATELFLEANGETLKAEPEPNRSDRHPGRLLSN